jgi:diguanylate cyclase (GGDEF)-like protein
MSSLNIKVGTKILYHSAISYNMFMFEHKTGLNPLASKKIFKELNNPPLEGELLAKNAADKIKKMIYVDPLTGCFNENFYNDFIEKFDPDRDFNTSFIFCDINNLKKTNDSFGHKAGDKLITDSVSIMKKNIRKGDLIIRPNGKKGDEMLIVCKNVGSSNSREFEEKINSRLKQQKLFAFGIAHFDKIIDNRNVKDTINRADKEMYKCKNKMKSTD